MKLVEPTGRREVACKSPNIKKIRAAQGGPLNRGAPCHGIIGILVNPALAWTQKTQEEKRIQAF